MFPENPRLRPLVPPSKDRLAWVVDRLFGARVVRAAVVGPACVASVYCVTLTRPPWQVAVRIGEACHARRDVTGRSMAKAAGVRVPETWWYGVEGSVAMTVLEWIGFPTLRVLVPLLSERDMERVGYNLGRALRHLHSVKAAAHGEIPTGAGELCYGSWLAFACAQVEGLAGHSRAWDVLEPSGMVRFVSELERMERLPPFHEGPVLVHHDINADNVLIEPDSLDVALIDFDSAMLGVPVLELPPARLGILDYALPLAAGFRSTFPTYDDVLSMQNWEVMGLLGRIPGISKLLTDYDEKDGSHVMRWRIFTEHWEHVLRMLPPARTAQLVPDFCPPARGEGDKVRLDVCQPGRCTGVNAG